MRYTLVEWSYLYYEMTMEIEERADDYPKSREEDFFRPPTSDGGGMISVKQYSAMSHRKRLIVS